MYLADYHLHSTCSPDGKIPMKEIARVAVEKGLQEICITDHLDTIYWGSYEPRTTFDWEESQRQFREAQSLYGDRLQLRVGAELGEATISFERAEILLKNAPALDYVIGSVHTASEKYQYLDLYYIPNQGPAYYDAIMRDYLAETKKLLMWGKFQVLGHFTLPLRYIRQNSGQRLSFDPYMDEVEEILRIMVDRGIGLELNTNRGDDPLPSEKICRLYHALGGEIVTLGSDAHQPEHIGLAVQPCQELLKRCGWRYFTTFDQGKPVFRPLP